MHDVGLQVLFSVAALLNLVFSLFFRLMSPLSKDETGRRCSSCNSCGVVIMDMLVDRRCFFPFQMIDTTLSKAVSKVLNTLAESRIKSSTFECKFVESFIFKQRIRYFFFFFFCKSAFVFVVFFTQGRLFSLNGRLSLFSVQALFCSEA